jgi:hypothetical protein
LSTNPWGLTIRLEPHIGIADSPLGPVEVKHPQWVVMAGSRQIEDNYGVPFVECGRAGFTARTIEFDAHTNKWPPEAKLWICDEVGRMTNTQRRGNSPVLPQAPTVVDVDDEVENATIEDLDD